MADEVVLHLRITIKDLNHIRNFMQQLFLKKQLKKLLVQAMVQRVIHLIKVNVWIEVKKKKIN